jgi:photoactive yellow protein
MRHSASQTHPFSARPSSDGKDRRPRASGHTREPHESQSAPSNQIPFGAIHVDASGVILEYRQTDARVPFPAARLLGQQFIAIAPWAANSAFLSALKSAIDCGNSSFHFDFKQSFQAVERSIHVNILASGRRTAWIFISDKTLFLTS